MLEGESVKILSFKILVI